MAVQLYSTRGVGTDGVKMLVYGASGVGKTTLAGTAPAPIVLSVENGLLSLREHDIPFALIRDRRDLEEVHHMLLHGADELIDRKTVILDSISEIAEVVLGEEKDKSADGRRAYGETGDYMGEMVRQFRDLPGRHVLMTAQLEQVQDDTGAMLFGPAMPGKKMGARLPYFFDEVFAMQIAKDKDGNTGRWLLTQPNGVWTAKDRSGALDAWEEPNIIAILEKIAGQGGIYE